MKQTQLGCGVPKLSSKWGFYKVAIMSFEGSGSRESFSLERGNGASGSTHNVFADFMAKLDILWVRP